MDTPSQKLRVAHTRFDVNVGADAWYSLANEHGLRMPRHTRSAATVGANASYCVATMHTVTSLHAPYASLLYFPAGHAAHERSDVDVGATDVPKPGLHWRVGVHDDCAGCEQ